MNDALYSDDQPAMWPEDFERKKHEEKARAERDRIEKARQDEIARERHKEQIKFKDQIDYNPELAKEICERIAAGELMLNVCRDSYMPTMRRCNAWLKTHEDFNALYKDALNDRLSVFEEETIAIADDAAADLKEVIRGGKEITVVDQEVIARAKLRVDVRFRHLKAGRPQKWGDSSTLVTKTADEEKLDAMTMAELDKTIAGFEYKNNIIKIV
jgi:hypothetical protein